MQQPQTRAFTIRTPDRNRPKTPLGNTLAVLGDALSSGQIDHATFSQVLDAATRWRGDGQDKTPEEMAAAIAVKLEAISNKGENPALIEKLRNAAQPAEKYR